MEIQFHKSFKKRFAKLPVKVQDKFYERTELFKKNKFARILNNHSVGKTFPDCRSINVTGDYRAIFSDQEDLVVFISIGTHSELY